MNSKVKFGFLLVIIALAFSVGLKSTPLNSQEVLDLLNRDRLSHGLSALKINPTLNLAALAKAQDMSKKNYFAHISPEGSTPWHWFKALGYNYTYAGENLAEGYTDPIELENSWMSSPSHRANILSPNYSEVGLAIVQHNNSNLVVQLFGGKDNKITFKD